MRVLILPIVLVLSGCAVLPEVLMGVNAAVGIVRIGNEIHKAERNKREKQRWEIQDQKTEFALNEEEDED